MSTHVVTDILVAELVGVLPDYLRAPSGVTRDGVNAFVVFSPDLSAAESDTLADLQAWLGGRLHVTVTFAEYRALKAQIGVLRDYLPNGAPTGAETVAAVKGTIRLLRALFRELT